MTHSKTQTLRTALSCATMLAGASLPACAWAQVGAEWMQAGGVPQGTRFSTLAEINTSNVTKLTEDFSYATGVIGPHEGGPLVVNNVMYIVTPWPNKLIALDLTNHGALLWQYEPADNHDALGRSINANRGAAYANGLVVYGELDGHVDAVNATTGKAAWRVQVTDPIKDSETLNVAPIIVINKVIIGDTLSEMGARGAVRALDLFTGKLIWKAYATGPDSDVLIDSSFHPFYAKDRGPDLGATTWPGTLWKHGGSTSWEWITYDPGTNLVFYGTSQPGVFNPDQRPGDNKWGASVFARDADTGKAAWAYQLTPHDNWDYDATNEYTVVDLQIKGVTRKTLVHFSKNGFAYVFDRVTGEVISATPYADGLNWATKVDLTTGLPEVVDAERTHQGLITKNECPSDIGAKDWQYSTYSPSTGLFYIGINNYCQNYQPLLTLYLAGTPFFGVNSTLSPSPHAGANLGAVVAWDPVQAKAIWSHPETLPVQGPGTLSTAGDLVFYGTLDNHFKALDAKTGALLWETKVECGIVSNPVAFLGADGHERVAFYTGVNGCPAGSNFGDSVGAHIPGAAVEARALYAALPPPAANTVKSGYVHVFKLQ